MLAGPPPALTLRANVRNYILYGDDRPMSEVLDDLSNTPPFSWMQQIEFVEYLKRLDQLDLDQLDRLDKVTDYYQKHIQRAEFIGRKNRKSKGKGKNRKSKGKKKSVKKSKKRAKKSLRKK